MRILFQGDSITDTGRTCSPDPAASLGEGYPSKAAPGLSTHEVINRGIGGNRTCDLVERWGKDCIDLKPDLVSILIGVNDAWRGFDCNDPTTDRQFEENLRNILNRTKSELNARLIVLSPYMLDETDARASMWADLQGKREVVARLAAEYGATFIDLQAEFDKMVAAGTAKTTLSADGVHPTDYGHEVIARLWLDAFNS